MPYGVSITKRTNWRGGTEEFSNVYHFSIGSAVTKAMADRLVDALKTLEAPVHTGQATFVTGRVWEVGGTPQQNETVTIKDLTGTGSLTTAAALYKELAVVVRIDTGRNSTTGRRIYLRKYIHPCGSPTSSSDSNTGVSTIGATMSSAAVTYGQAIREVTPTAGETWTLESPNGQPVTTSSPVSALDYFRIRQFTGR